MCLDWNVSCAMDRGLIPLFRLPTCPKLSSVLAHVVRKTEKNVDVSLKLESSWHGRLTYYRNSMLVALDEESEDASDDDNHERRNGRHPEQLWQFLSLKFCQNKTYMN